MLDKAIELCAQTGEMHHSPAAPAQADMLKGRDLDWDDLMSNAVETACVPVKATDPSIYYIHQAQQANQKGLCVTMEGHAVALRWSMEYIYG